MSTLLKRAHRVLLYIVAAVFGLSLFAPMVSLANTDLVTGDQAQIDNPNGTGANLRSDYTALDDSTILSEIEQGTTVTIGEGPFIVDSGTWFWVFGPEMQEGFIEASMLREVTAEPPAEAKVTDEVPVEETASEEVAEPTSVLPWLNAIEFGFVVDNNNELPVDGLAVRVDATVDGEILGRVPVNATLEVTEARIWNGDQSFVRINYAGQGGYVNGSYVVLESEQVPVVEEIVVAEEPVIPEPVIDEPVVTEDVTDTITEEPVVEEPVVEDPATTEDDVADDIVSQDVVDVVTEEPVIEEPVIDEPVVTDDVAEVDVEEPAFVEEATEVVGEEPIAAEEHVVTEEQTADDVAADDVREVIAEEPVVEAPAATTEESTEVETEEPVVEEAHDTEVATGVATEEVADEASEDTTEVVTEEIVEETEAVVTEEATEVATEEMVVTTQAAANTVPASDTSKMIGSATVTGTNGDGLRCRVAPSDDAATIMVLAEGTKVYVLAEPVNGYLGIDCGGLQGFADVNYMWSGGAGDEELRSAKSTVIVTGTGSGLNCRTGAGTSFPVITVLRDGTSVQTRAAASNGWVAVTCAGQNGFVATQYVQLSSSSSTGSGSTGSTGTGTATVSNTGSAGLRCRSGAGTTYSIITVLGPGTTVTVRGASQGSWTPIVCGGANGWAHSDFLTMGSTGSAPAAPSNPTPAPSTGTVTVVNTGSGGLNCRSGAGTSHPVITVLRLGQTVNTRSGSTSGWTAVVCGGTNGFVSSQYVSSTGSTSPTPSPAPAPSGMVSGDHAKATANVNLRYSASLGAGVATVVPTGTVVLVTGNITNGFYPVNYDGLTGFMSGDYLSKTSDALTKRGGSATPGTTTPPTSGGGTATGNALVDYAMKYVGYPYVWATHGPASFDCSGFTYWVVYNVLGKNIGYGTWTQVAAGTPVSRSNLQPGDLVFFQNTYTAGLSHVGMYIGNNQFIHAQNEATGVVISDLDSSYYGPRWYGAVRL